MDKIRNWLNQFIQQTGEQPIYIMLNKEDWDNKQDPRWPEIQSKKVVRVDQLPDSLLDRPFDSGYGGQEGPSFIAYSISYIMFTTEYDGSESWSYVPRNPVDNFDWSSA
jgi:hypothetical protein